MARAGDVIGEAIKALSPNLFPSPPGPWVCTQADESKRTKPESAIVEGKEMTYCMVKISWIEVIWYLVKLLYRKLFGSKSIRTVNPETGEDDPNGIRTESEYDMACCEWAWFINGSTSDNGPDFKFIIDRIWWSKASPELQDQRCKMEAADEELLRYAK